MKNRLKRKALRVLVTALLIVGMLLPITAQAKVFNYYALLGTAPEQFYISPYTIITTATSARLVPHYSPTTRDESGWNMVTQGAEISYRFNDSSSTLIELVSGPRYEEVWVPEVIGTDPIYGYPITIPAHWETKIVDHGATQGPLVTGLEPNRNYNFYLEKAEVNIRRAGAAGGIGGVVEWDYVLNIPAPAPITATVYTDSVAPTNPTYTNIKATSLTVNWTKGENYLTPQYKVYQRIKKAVPDPWTLVYQGTEETVDITNLEFETTYEYYVNATGINGVSLNSSITTVTTSADPAVAAAEAAKGAAEAGMFASEQAKTAAQKAEANTEELKTKVDTLETKIDKLPTDILPPTVSATLAGNKTITFSATETVYAEVEDNISPLSDITYRVSVNNNTPGTWQAVPGGGAIEVELPTRGLQKIKLWVRDKAGNTTVKELRLWRI